ncbi:MAG: prolipoprotein diacylglyceryl transferase [Clostridia bacterium]|nr:prolipoprotein diacylglyceryl transferase [Clostridia bacterium]
MYNFLDKLIISVADAGIHGVVYRYINTASFFVALIFSIFNRKKFNIPFWQVIIFVYLNDLFMGYVNKYVLWAGTGFKNFDERNMAVSFAFIPILALLLSLIFRKDYGNVLDFLAFPPMVAHAVCRWACIFPGCCYGYEFKFGIYNVHTSTKLFPVQLLESLISIIIVVVLLIVFKKQNSVSRGFLMPLMLIMYGTARFFTEFLHDAPKMWMGISYIAFNCLFMVIVGILLLFIMKRRYKLRSDTYVPQKS